MSTAYTTAQAVRYEAGLQTNPDIVDTTINGYIVRAHSIVESYISAAYSLPSVQVGAPGFAGSQAEGLLKGAETLIAAGYLMFTEYGTEGLDTDKDGQRMIREGELLLQRLTDEKRPLRLVDSNGLEFPRVSASSSGGLTASNLRSAPIFSVGDRF